jgi:hypothetical protein
LSFLDILTFVLINLILKKISLGIFLFQIKILFIPHFAAIILYSLSLRKFRTPQYLDLPLSGGHAKIDLINALVVGISWAKELQAPRTFSYLCQ